MQRQLRRGEVVGEVVRRGGDRVAVLHHPRPAVLRPLHTGDERLPAEPVEAFRAGAPRSDAEVDRGPAVGPLDQVGVPGRLDRVRGAAVGEDGVVRAGLERAPR